MDPKILLITLLVVIGIIIVGGCIDKYGKEPEVSEPHTEEKPTITIHCKDNTTETLNIEHEKYNKILNESMKILNSADKYVYLLVPEKIKNETIHESYVKLTFSKQINISNNEISAKKIILVLSGEYKDMIFVYDGKYWNTRSPEIGTITLESLTGCVGGTPLE